MDPKLPKLEEMKDILDLKGIEIWDATPWLLILGALIGFIILFAIWWFWKRKRNHKQDSAPPLTPFERALQRIDQLKNSEHRKPGKVRPFYFALSEVFREFLEEEVGIQATEATLEELRPLLKTISDWTQEEMRQGIWLMELSDMAKFAKYIPPEEDIQKSLETCRELIVVLERRRRLLKEQSA